MTYTQTLEYLFTAMPSFQNIGGDAYKPGLERIENFSLRLGNPHRKFRVVHIAGTNGKGSVSHIIASALQHSGYRTALFTSPHLRDFRERIKVNGEMISQTQVVEFVERYRADMEELQLSFFEMTAAMAFDHFACEGVDVAVIETGLGGRLDATNIVSPLLSVITNIGLDHTKFLGTTLPQIAAEKGGIIKSHTPVVLGERGEEYTSTIEDIAKSHRAQLIFAQDKMEVISQQIIDGGQRFKIRESESRELFTMELDMAGVYQSKNIVTALTALKALGLNTPVESIRKGLSRAAQTTSLLGRWQTLSLTPRVVCDTGHNAHGLRYVMEQLRHTPYNRLIMVLGFANDKNIDEILPLFDLDAHFIFTRPKVQRALAAEVAEGAARKLGYDCEVVDDVAEALRKAKKMAAADDLIFVGGSNFVVAEVI